MNCKKCIHCVQNKKGEYEVICGCRELLTSLGKIELEENDSYFNKVKIARTISEPGYCVYYKTPKEWLKETFFLKGE